MKRKMKRKPDDAFGQQLLDWFHGAEVAEIVEREDGYINAGGNFGKSVYFAPFKQWPRNEQRAVRYVRGRVLDIGAGAGRHALELQHRGHRVTAIDVSPGALAVCRKRGVRDARLLSVEDVGMLPPNSFDTVIMMGNNFGLLQSFRKGRTILRALHRTTTDSGRIVASTMDPYKTDNPMHRWYHRWNRARGRMGGQIRLRIRYKKLVGPWFDYLFVSRAELKTMLSGTGWKLGKTIPGEGAAYIAILEKEKI